MIEEEVPSVRSTRRRAAAVATVVGMSVALAACGVGESHRGYLGTGSVDFPSLLAALERVGYDDTIAFESFSSAVVSPDLSTVLCIWRNMWEDGMDLAATAREFVERERARAAATA